MSEDVLVRVRRSRDFFGRLRRLQVLIDGEVRLRLAYGEEKSVVLAPGPHTFQAKMDWVKSPKLILETQVNDRLSLDCSSKFLLVSFLFAFVAPGRIFTLSLANSSQGGTGGSGKAPRY